MTENNTATQTTDEAMDRLGSAKGYYVAMARFIAVQIATGRDPWYSLAQIGPDPEKRALLPEKGTVHSYAIRMAMERSGVLDGYRGKLFFLGTAMKSEIFEPTGAHFSYSHQDADGAAVHQRTIGVWRIKKGAAAQSFLEPATPADIAKRRDEYRAQESTTAKARENALRGRGLIK